MDGPPFAGVDTDQLAPLCSLEDPTRRRLYDHVVTRGEPVSRDRVSDELGIDRSTVAYHLDRLVDQGLLTASFARPSGRTGPGAGRPAKHYQRSEREFAVSVPPRDYRLAAELFARAAEADTTGTVGPALSQAASDLGRELAAGDDRTAADLLTQLARWGFEPFRDGDVVRLRNCPFKGLAQQHAALVCDMNLALLAGRVDAADAAYEACSDPTDGCCVALVPRAEASPT